MKKLAIIIIVGLRTATSYGLNVPDINETILNTNINQAVNTTLVDDPIRDGLYNAINDESNNNNIISNIIGNDNQILNFGQAQNKTLALIGSIINYALWLIALVALIYLLYHGFLMVTASGDEERFNKGLQGIKYAAIAIAGVWLSRFLVSIIFYLIDIFIQ